jgi:hypothetical protein
MNIAESWTEIGKIVNKLPSEHPAVEALVNLRANNNSWNNDKNQAIYIAEATSHILTKMLLFSGKKDFDTELATQISIMRFSAEACELDFLQALVDLWQYLKKENEEDL